MTRGAIFDCDGVIVDSEPLSCQASIDTLRKYGVNLKEGEITGFIGCSNQQIVAELAKRYQIELPPGLAGEIERHYLACAGKLQAMPGLPDTLVWLKSRGYRLAVASSGSHARILFSLEKAQVVHCFDAICSASEVKNGKPAPDLFLLAARRLGLSPRECLVVEDSLHGIAGARSAGMAAFAFSSSHPAASLSEAGAHAVFGRFSEFPGLVEQWERLFEEGGRGEKKGDGAV